MNRNELLRDIMALDQAIDEFLGDLRNRASWDRSNVDVGGGVALPCGIGVLHRLGTAREQLGKHVPLLATPAPPVEETDRLSIIDIIEGLEIKLPGVGVGLADGAAIAKRQILAALADRTQEGEVRRG